MYTVSQRDMRGSGSTHSDSSGTTLTLDCDNSFPRHPLSTPHVTRSIFPGGHELKVTQGRKDRTDDSGGDFIRLLPLWPVKVTTAKNP